MKTLRIGTRGSPLALRQAHWVRDTLLGQHPGLPLEIVQIKTLAEKFPEREVAEIGVGIFTREIDEALLRGDIDLAVHSLKDLPSEIPSEIVIGAIPERKSPLDAFISADGRHFDELPQGARIGTGSPRRKAQLLHRRPDLEIVPLRGNVATRVSKMRDLQLGGIILAQAGLERLGEDWRITHTLPPDLLVPAVSQGALGITARRDDPEVLAILLVCEHEPSRLRAKAERGFLRRLRGGCQAPAGALATLPGSGHLSIRGVVAAPDGSSCIRGELAGGTDEAESLGSRLAEEILERGGAAILRSLPREKEG